METLDVSCQILLLIQIFLTNATTPVLAPISRVYLTNTLLLDVGINLVMRQKH